MNSPCTVLAPGVGWPASSFYTPPIPIPTQRPALEPIPKRLHAPKLTPAEVRTIRELRALKTPYKYLENLYGVERSTLYNVLHYLGAYAKKHEGV